MNDIKAFVDQIILENRLAQERVDKLFERLEGCEKRLKNVSRVLDRMVDQVNLIQSLQSTDCGPRSPSDYHYVENGCGDTAMGDYYRQQYEDSIRKEIIDKNRSTSQQIGV